MRALGIARKVDELGRIVLPKKLRKSLDIEPGYEVEMYVEDGNLIVEKYQVPCHICGKTEQLLLFKNKGICQSCKEAISEL